MILIPVGKRWSRVLEENTSALELLTARSVIVMPCSLRELLHHRFQLQPSANGGEVAQPGSSTSQPPRNTAIPLPSPQDQSFLINITFLKVLLWLVLLGLFVELEFGLAYFVLSLFYWMYVGTRGPEERKEGEKSAYSVFNPGCEAIQGTLTAEQLERELQFRPLEGR
ncbi:SAYSvFN domain-containing protein 1 [Prionailurus iriomotensis]